MVEEMAPMLATLTLLDYEAGVVAKRHPKRFEQFASRFDVSVARAREVFKNMRLNHLQCETRVGPFSVGFPGKR